MIMSSNSIILGAAARFNSGVGVAFGKAVRVRSNARRPPVNVPRGTHTNEWVLLVC